MKKIMITLSIILCALPNVLAQAIVADHSCTAIKNIPVAAIEAAKSNLHIAYGHTSHGSQITDGMSGLVNFMNGQGYPTDLFKWSHNGSDGTLHLYEGDGYGDGDLDHDAGYYPAWVQETRDYLGAVDAGGRGSNHPEMNVIMWSWCGQLSGYSSTDVQTKYLDEMDKLEGDYPNVTFVYMTGHSDGSGLSGTLHKNNVKIRDYCLANEKVLFDFYDIECYDPDGNYYGDKHVSDDCSYDGGNWATEWQNSHNKGEEWYECGSAHSQPLNANLKAYAIWWLWARLAGWDGKSAETVVQSDLSMIPPSPFTLYANYPNPFNSCTTIRYRLYKNATVSLSIFALNGRRVFFLPQRLSSAGDHHVKIDLLNEPSGLYYYRLDVGEMSEMRRFVLLR